MADEEQEHLEDGWQAKDLRSGVAKVYAEAKRRNVLGIRAATVWAVVLLIYGCLDIVGVASVAPMLWGFAAGLVTILLVALSMSRTPGPLLITFTLVLIDLVLVAYRIPELYERGEAIDFWATSIRVVAGPVAALLVLDGYLGALSIQAFKRGFSPGADWRTRVNPLMLKAVVIGSCVGAVLLGMAVWFGAIRSGFAERGAYFVPRDFLEVVHDVQESSGLMNVLPFSDEPGPTTQDYPEAAVPIESLAGLDTFAQRAVREAFEFGAESDEQGCVLEGQGRQSRCREDRCKHWSRVFVRACLTKTPRLASFCEGVPAPTAVEEGIEWAKTRCAGRVFDLCREILYAVQGHCHPPED